jgi:hypothetical protein
MFRLWYIQRKGFGSPSIGALPSCGYTCTQSLISRIALTVVTLFVFIPSAIAASVTNVSTTSPNGTYTSGDAITLTITFDEVVVVSGTPLLVLNTGGANPNAVYVGGSNSPTLTFQYTPTSGDSANPLEYVSVSSLRLNGGSITTSSEQAVDLTLPTPGAEGSLSFSHAITVDAVKPSVLLEAQSAIVSNDQVFSFKIIFSEPVSNFTISDFIVTNALVTSLTRSDDTYLATFQAQSEGDITVSLPADSVVDSVSLGNTASNTLSFRYDITPPVVVSVRAIPSTAIRKSGGTVDVLVQYSEPVWLMGDGLTLTLETGDLDRSAVFVSGSGTDTLRFRYTVEDGDNTEDLSYAGTSALTLLSGDILDTAGNLAETTLPEPGDPDSLSATSAIIVDTTPPTVTLSTSSPSTVDSDLIPITITFSEAVTGFTVNDISVQNGSATLLSGSGMSYTAYVVPRAQGDVVVSLPSNRVIDRAGNWNLSAQESLTFTLVTESPTTVTVYSTTPNGDYKAGETITILVEFSESVLVYGTPTLALSSGGTAYYTAGSGTNTLTFTYTILSGQNASDLDYSSLPPLSLHGGAIRDAATDSRDVRFTFAAPGLSGSLAANNAIVVDTIAPTISYVTALEPNGAYHEEETIHVQVVFSENIVMEGSPSLVLATDDTDEHASLIALSGRVVSLAYIIQEGNNTERLNYASVNAFNTNGATITDKAGNIAIISLPSTTSNNSLGKQKNITIDTIHPWVEIVSASIPSGRYKAGSQIPVTVAFSERVTVAGVPKMGLQIGDRTDEVPYISGSGTSTLTFTYTVQDGDSTELLQYIDTSSLQLDGGFIIDRARNESEIVLPAPGTASSLSFNRTIAFDTTPPSIEAVSISTAPGQYSIGTNIEIRVLFDEPVLISGTPRILLNTEPTNAYAYYKSGSGGREIIFEYTVTANQNSIDLAWDSNDSLQLVASATITDVAGNDTVLTLPESNRGDSLDGSNRIVIDTSAPTVVAVSSDIADGFYRVGAEVPIVVTFNEPTFVSPSVVLRLRLNNTAIDAVYAGGGGTTDIRFMYTVESTHNTDDLDYFNTSSLYDASASILDQAGNTFSGVLPQPGAVGSLGATKNIIIDTTPPSSPVVIEPGDRSMYRKNVVLVKGTAEPLSQVKVSFGSTHSCSETSLSDGTWQCTVSDLADGAYNVSAHATDRAGNRSSDSNSTQVFIENDALIPPSIVSPQNGMTTDPHPTFSGTGHPNKLTKILDGATPVCTATVSTDGNWSCPSSITFSEGYHTLTAYTEDPIDSATSVPVTFTLAVGQTYSGVVYATNREKTPLKGVRITDGVNSVETDETGQYTFVVPQVGSASLSADKYGWNIAQASAEVSGLDGGVLDWLATPTLEQKTFGIWFIQDTIATEKLRITNGDPSSATADGTLYNSDGVPCDTVPTTPVKSYRSVELSIPISNCSASSDNYGLLEVEYSGQLYRGEVGAFKRTAAEKRRVYSYSAMDLQNKITGTSYSFFDTAFYKDRSSQTRRMLKNELIIANLRESEEIFTINRYRSDSTLVGTRVVVIPSQGVKSVEFDDSLANEPLNGIDVIVPGSQSTPYIAVRRRSPSKATSFSSLEPVVNSGASTLFGRVQYFPSKQAVQYAEIANISDALTEVTITRYSRSGKARPAISLALQPRETRKIRLSRVLRRYKEGSLEIISSTPNALVVNSVVKHYAQDETLRQIHFTPLRESYGDLLFGNVSTTVAPRSVLKVSNTSSVQQTATVSCFHNGEIVRSTVYSLRPRSFRSLNLTFCANGDEPAVLEVNGSDSGVVVADIIHYTKRSLGEHVSRMW